MGPDRVRVFTPPHSTSVPSEVPAVGFREVVGRSYLCCVVQRVHLQKPEILDGVVFESDQENSSKMAFEIN